MLAKFKGFSLIELLVVVAIIAVLAAVAIPAYLQYQVRAQVTQVVPLMNSLIEQVQKTYQATGAFPTAPTFPGTATPFTVANICNGGLGTAWISVNVANFSNVAQFIYQVNTNMNGAVIGVQFNKLNIAGFSYSPGTGTYDALYFATREVNGVMDNACGGNANISDVPTSYRPAGCSCNNIGLCQASNGFLNGGFSGCSAANTGG